MTKLLTRLGIRRETSFHVDAPRQRVAEAFGRLVREGEASSGRFSLPFGRQADAATAFRGTVGARDFSIKTGRSSPGNQNIGSRVKGSFSEAGEQTVVRATAEAPLWFVALFAGFALVVYTIALVASWPKAKVFMLIILAHAAFMLGGLLFVVRTMVSTAVRDLEREMVYAVFRVRK